MAATWLYSSTLSSAISSPNLKLHLKNSIYIKGLAGTHLFSGLSEKISKNDWDKKVSYTVTCSQSTIKKIEKDTRKVSRKGEGRLMLSEGRDQDEDYGLICPGCGVFMQDKDPNLPGFYKKRKVEVSETLEDKSEEDLDGLMDDEFDDFDEEEEASEDGIEGKLLGDNRVEGRFENDDGVNWDLEELESEFEKDDDALKDLDGFGPVGVGYGNITEEIIGKGKKRRLSKVERQRLSRETQREKEEVTVCV